MAVSASFLQTSISYEQRCVKVAQAAYGGYWGTTDSQLPAPAPALQTPLETSRFGACIQIDGLPLHIPLQTHGSGAWLWTDAFLNHLL